MIRKKIMLAAGPWRTDEPPRTEMIKDIHKPEIHCVTDLPFDIMAKQLGCLSCRFCDKDMIYKKRPCCTAVATPHILVNEKPGNKCRTKRI